MIQYKHIKQGERIRHRSSKQWYLVIDKTTAGIFLTNLMLFDNPAYAMFLLPRDYEDWDNERDINLDPIDQGILTKIREKTKEIYGPGAEGSH